MIFQAVIQLHGKSATGIPVSPEILASLGPAKRPPVRVTIKGYTYRTTIGIMGGQFLIPVSAEQRAGAGVEAGEQVVVQLELDTEARELTVPADFAEALNGNTDAKLRFEALSYSNRRRIVLGIDSAKTVETRQRRIDQAISMLQEGRH